jgi:hypothetical protein
MGGGAFFVRRKSPTRNRPQEIAYKRKQSQKEIALVASRLCRKIDPALTAFVEKISLRAARCKRNHTSEPPM